jgi:hypothetical protein
LKAQLFFIMMFTLTGCISVSLAPPKPTTSKGVKFDPPPAPFQKASAENVDAIFRNTKNGNAISFVSDCSDTTDPALTSIEQGVLMGLTPYTYESQTDTKFDGRSARRVKVKGTVDGVASTVDLLIFKRNSCIYILSYAGLEQHHAANQREFEAFLERFHAP